jgi:hypothetical protein
MSDRGKEMPLAETCNDIEVSSNFLIALKNRPAPEFLLFW